MQSVHENNPLSIVTDNPKSIVTDKGDYKLEELRQNLLKRNHPEKIINYSFTKSFQPKNNKEENKEIITFTRASNPNHNFNYNRFNNCLNKINN